MADKDAPLGAVTLSVAQAVSLWTVLLPPITEIRRHTPGTSPDFAADVRHAEMVAGTLAVTVGGIMACLEKSYAPIVASGVLVASMIVAYEYTLNMPASKTPRFTVITNNEEVN